MTKISNQYSLTNILTADLANSRLGINNVSPAYSLDLTGTARVSGAVTFSSSVSALSLDVISSSGVGSSTASGLARFITAGTTTAISIGQSNSARKLDIGSYSISVTGEQLELSTVNSYPLILNTSGSERMRITSGGNVLIGTTTDNSFLLDVAANTTNFAAMVRNITSSACNGLYIYFPNSTSSTTSQAFLRGESAAGLKAMIYTNGSYGSATGTYGSIVSDLRLKENISEATSKLNDILKLRVVNFNITADLDKKKQIGFIAQEFKEVFPSLVFEIDTREYDKNGNLIKGLENAMGLSVGMEFAILTKAIQELSAKVSLLENK